MAKRSAITRTDIAKSREVSRVIHDYCKQACSQALRRLFAAPPDAILVTVPDFPDPPDQSIKPSFSAKTHKVAVGKWGKWKDNQTSAAIL